MSAYYSMTECRKWTGELKGERTWVTEMEQVEKEYTGFVGDGEEATCRVTSRCFESPNAYIILVRMHILIIGDDIVMRMVKGGVE